MTLFALAAGDGENPFQQALRHFWDNRMNERTLTLLGGEAALRSRVTPAAGLAALPD